MRLEFRVERKVIYGVLDGNMHHFYLICNSKGEKENFLNMGACGKLQKEAHQVWCLLYYEVIWNAGGRIQHVCKSHMVRCP